MSEQTMPFMLDIILRYLSIVAGIITIFLGYRVFVKSTEKSNDLTAKQVIPSIIFALLGTLIILATILQDTFSSKAPIPVQPKQNHLTAEIKALQEEVRSLSKTVRQKEHLLSTTPVIESQSNKEKRADLLAIEENIRQTLGLNDSVKIPATIAKNDSLLKGFIKNIDTLKK